MSPVPDIIIALIVAAAENGVIGRGGRLPWHMPSDLKTFRRLTLGKPIVMGRKTFESIGKPLDGRDNIVVTRDAAFAHPGVEVAASLDAALSLAEQLAKRRGVDEIAVIGGAEIYRAAYPRADRIYLTRIHARPDGDATFADPSPLLWLLTSSTPIAASPRDDHKATLLIYDRIDRLAA